MSEELTDEIRAQLRASLALAIARYLREHPEAKDRARSWIRPDVEEWLDKPVEEIAAEARRRHEALERWSERAKAEAPDLWETRRVDFLHARSNLDSTETGNFQSGAGSFYDFLQDVGAPAESFDVA
jgi:hypothetical protein